MAKIKIDDLNNFIKWQWVSKFCYLVNKRCYIHLVKMIFWINYQNLKIQHLILLAKLAFIYFQTSTLLLNGQQKVNKQECIPVGCVPPTAVAVLGGSPPGTPQEEAPPREEAPPPRRKQPLPPGGSTPQGRSTPRESTPPGRKHPTPGRKHPPPC